VYQDSWVKEIIILFVCLPTPFIVTQNPQVEGATDQHRYLIDSKTPSPTRRSQYDSDSGLVLSMPALLILNASI
jgi:hypothetical protein